MRDHRGPIIAALDVGSTKVVVSVAAVKDNEIHVVGVGKAENRGVKQGQIVHIEETVSAIQEAKQEAELMAGIKISHVYLSIGGEAQCITSTGLVPIRQNTVDKEDIRRVLDVARAIHLPQDSRILHALPQSYTIDGQEGIDNPIDMQGVRLEVQAQLITVSEKAVSNLVSCVQKAGLKIKQMVLAQYASTKACIGDDEKGLGVTVVDMGAGTCDIISFKEGSVTHIGSIPVGGLNFTQDVAVGMKTPLMNAESIKKKFGTSLIDMVSTDENIEVEGLGERKQKTVLRSELCKILEARSEETLSLIFQKLSEWDVLKDMGAGVILTGGASLLQGLVELGEFTFDIPVRKGVPKNVFGAKEAYNSPVFATAIGTLLFGFEEEHQVKRKVRSTKKVSFGTWDKMKNFMGKTLSI